MTGQNTGQCGGAPGGFEELLDPLIDLGSVMHHRRSSTGQVPGLANGHGRYELTVQQIVGDQLRQPRRIVPVGLPARDVPCLFRVDQHHRQLVFHQVVKRLPIVAGRLHDDRGDLLGFQVVN